MRQADNRQSESFPGGERSLIRRIMCSGLHPTNEGVSVLPVCVPIQGAAQRQASTNA
jgi:hypothetical protein